VNPGGGRNIFQRDDLARILKDKKAWEVGSKMFFQDLGGGGRGRPWGWDRGGLKGGGGSNSLGSSFIALM